MAENIGPKIGIDGEAAFRQSLKNIVQQTKELDAEFKMVTSTFTKNGSAQDKLQKQAEVLGRQFALQKDKVELLKKAYDDSAKKLEDLKKAAEETAKAHGNNSKEAQQANAAYERQVSVVSKAKTAWYNATTACNKMESELADTEEALKSNSKQTKDLGNAMDDTGKKSSVFGDLLKANLVSDAIKAGLSKMVDLIKQLGSAFAELVSDSLSGFGDYEQLVGGVKTLFGTETSSLQEYADSVGKSVDEAGDKYNDLLTAQNTVFANARKSWKTTGLSANDYMETVTGFAASLVSSLGGDTVQAAKYADMALVDMADNANKMGTNMSDIQHAYQGFAKQNYTMLDNLKLGYGGTKTEMERLVKEAAAMTDVQAQLGESVDASSLSYDNIVKAIHVVQADMGIMGTTSKEASTTIQGSVNAMKGAWENFLVGMADPEQDFDALIGDLVDSVTTAAGNILPRLQEIIPTLIEGLGKIGTSLLPLAQDLALEMASSFAEGLTAMGSSLIEVVPQLIQAAVAIIPELAAVAMQIVQGLAAGFTAAAPELLQNGIEMLGMVGTGLVSGIPQLLEQVLPIAADIASNLRENAGQLVDAGIQFILNLAQGLMNALPTMLAYIPGIVSDIAGIINDNAPKLLSAGVQLIGVLGMGLIQAIPALLENLPYILKAMADVITAFNWIDIGGKIMTALGNGIMGMGSAVTSGIQNAFDGGLAYVKSLPGKFKSWAIDMINGFVDGILSSMSKVADAVKNVAATITSYMHFSRPDVGPLREYESWMPDFMRGLAGGIDANSWRVEDAVDRLTRKMGIELTAAQTGGAVINQTINFGYEVQAPDVVAREVRRTTTYGLAGA